MNYCSECGHAITRRIPAGDCFPRDVCDQCNTVHYVNPKVITGCIPEHRDGRLLLCKRAIEPRLGYWTFPAGFLELHETSAEGAARETLEESGATVEVGGVLAVMNIPHVSQVYIVHRGRLLTSDHHPTNESSETKLVEEADIPWNQIAFPTIYHSLKYFCQDRAAGNHGAFHLLDIKPNKRPD